MMRNIRRYVMAALVVVTVSAPATSIAQMQDQRKPPLRWYCMLPFAYLIDAVSQSKHDRETVKVTIHSREVTFRKNRLYYYHAASADEPRIVEFGEMVRGCEFPVGEKTIGFARGEMKFYRSGAVMYGTLARPAEFIADGVTVRLAPERAGFHENGGLMYGSLLGRTKFTLGGIEYDFGPGQAEFYPSGKLKAGISSGKQTVRSGTRELAIKRGGYAEFDPVGNLEMVSLPVGAGRGLFRIPAGGGNIDFEFASFYPGLVIKMGQLLSPMKIMTGSGEFTFTSGKLCFHETGAVKSGILAGGIPLQMKGGDVTPEKEMNAEFREDGTLEKLFSPDMPFRSFGRIMRSTTGEKLICSYVVFDPRGWIREAYLESPATFSAGAQTVRVRGKAGFHPGEAFREGALLGEQVLLVNGRRKLCGGYIEFTEGGSVSRCESMRSAK